MAAGSRWKHDRGVYGARTAKLVERMRHPGGTSSGSRWMPLARFVGWPSYTLSQLAYIIMRESSGRERAYNGVIGCTGLLQIWPGHVSDPWRLTDAMYNLQVGLRLWRSQGWSPWAVQ
jgi:hypothetical protein